jgi:hypothetical protein
MRPATTLPPKAKPAALHDVRRGSGSGSRRPAAPDGSAGVAQSVISANNDRSAELRRVVAADRAGDRRGRAAGALAPDGKPRGSSAWAGFWSLRTAAMSLRASIPEHGGVLVDLGGDEQSQPAVPERQWYLHRANLAASLYPSLCCLQQFRSIILNIPYSLIHRLTDQHVFVCWFHQCSRWRELAGISYLEARKKEAARK